MKTLRLKVFTFVLIAAGIASANSFAVVTQEKARDFAGQKVKIKGRIVGKTIRVTAIEAVT